MSTWYGSLRPLSIIVPVFNTEERYLRPCLASIEACSSEGFRPEVVIVDDGSDPAYSDALPGILSGFDIDVALYRKENGGQNSARNLGVIQATGDYILFLDSDDRLAPRSLATVLEAALAERPSLLCFNYDRIDSDGALISHCGPWRGGYRQSESLSDFISESDSLCRQLYCRQNFVDTGIKLFEGSRIGEDMASAVVLLLAMGDAASIGETPYLYVQRPTSVLHTGVSDHVFDILDSASWMLQSVRAASDIYDRELEALCVEHVLFWGGGSLNQSPRCERCGEATPVSLDGRALRDLEAKRMHRHPGRKIRLGLRPCYGGSLVCLFRASWDSSPEEGRSHEPWRRA